MANIQQRTPENVPGRFYVDDTCIDCDQCRSLAPQFFTRHDHGGYSYVYHQPETPDEIQQAEAALLECPTESIGRDEKAEAQPHHT